MERDAERRRLLLVRDRGLDRLCPARDRDPVPVAEQVVERAAQVLRGQAGEERVRQVEGLDCHRLAVREPEPLDHEDLLGRRNLQETAQTGTGEGRGHRQRTAPGHHPAPPHVLAERGHRQLLGDLRLLDVGAAAAPAHEVALAREVVERRADGQPGDAEVGRELPLGGDRVADAETLDQVHDLLAGRALLGHALGSGRRHCPATIAESPEIGQCHCARSIVPV